MWGLRNCASHGFNAFMIHTLIFFLAYGNFFHLLIKGARWLSGRSEGCLTQDSGVAGSILTRGVKNCFASLCKTLLYSA